MVQMLEHTILKGDRDFLRTYERRAERVKKGTNLLVHPASDGKALLSLETPLDLT